MADSSILEEKELPGRGRGLVTTRDVEAGEVVLEEAPLFLTPYSEYRTAVCAACLKALAQPGNMQCASCCACFCSHACEALARTTPWVHSPGVCTATARAGALGLDQEKLNALTFLIQAYAVRRGVQQGDARAAAVAAELEGICGDGGDLAPAWQDLHAALCGVLGESDAAITPAQVATLLRKEQLNAYCVMAPSDADGERRVRGSGIWPRAARINHECMPNVARFDDFDADDAARTHIRMRALCDLPKGTEVLQSYFPLTWSYEERQAQCRDDYGFSCECARCKLESAWDLSEAAASSDGGDAPEGDVDGEAGAGDSVPCMDDAQGGSVEAPAEHDDPEGELDPTYLQLFLLKYVCPDGACGGTMAPMPGPSMSAHECNMCGKTRTEEEFLADLERDCAGDDGDDASM